MANEKNLTRAGIEIDSTEKAQKLGRLGGVRSGEVKREKKMWREIFNEQLKKRSEEMGVESLDIHTLLDIIQKGKEENKIKAVGLALEYTQEKPKQSLEHTGKDGGAIYIVSSIPRMPDE